MFNVHVFMQSLLFLWCLLVAAGGVFVLGRHRWLPVQITGLIVAIVALAAAIGVVCA